MAICAGTVYVFYCHARQVLFDSLRDRLALVAANASIQVKADDLASLRTRRDESSPAYKKVKTALKQVKAVNPNIRFIYTLRPGDAPLKWRFIVDAEADPKLQSHVGDEFDVSEYPDLIAGLSKPSADTEITRDKWGEWVSGYAPIRDRSGRSVGIIGVDMPASLVTEEMASIRDIGIYCVLIGALISIVLGAALSTVLMAPLGSLVERLRAVARGDHDTPVDDRRRDEIGEVSKSFNSMLRALKHKDEMLSQMNVDYLTGLHNHRYFQERLHEETVLAAEKGRHLSLLMIDLDKFKSANDSLGHIVGDNILTQVSTLLQRSTPENHILARYGGEEFAVILPDTSTAEAVSIAEHLRSEVAEHEFAIPQDLLDPLGVESVPPVMVTISIGVATYPQHSKEQDGLIMAADIALYRAKHLGRNLVCAYEITVSDDGAESDPYYVYTFIQDPSKSAIEALAAAVDARDPYTRNHSENICRYSLMIAEEYGLNEAEIEVLRMASLLHDVGKIGVPDYILNKPADLTSEETEIIRTHPLVGEAIIRNSRNLDAILPGILYHHEYYDGGGYPHGLAGDGIPLIARMISVADAYDALTTNRPYRRALSANEAIYVLRENSGTQFDPHVVEAFVRAMNSAEAEQSKSAA